MAAGSFIIDRIVKVQGTLVIKLVNNEQVSLFVKTKFLKYLKLYISQIQILTNISNLLFLP